MWPGRPSYPRTDRCYRHRSIHFWWHVSNDKIALRKKTSADFELKLLVGGDLVECYLEDSCNLIRRRSFGLSPSTETGPITGGGTYG